jgi:hypothetical protein
MAAPQEATKQAEQQQQIVEEDEFEEFEAEDWDARQEDPKNQALWEQVRARGRCMPTLRRGVLCPSHRP